MNVRFLESFVWVARLRSFKAAADRLFTTQTGISNRIATLEEQFGVRLFDREHRSVTLTPDGLRLLPHAERMLELQAQMLAAIGRDEVYSGVLRIGVIETVVQTWLPQLLSRLARQYPKITLELTSDVTPALKDALLRGTLDCVITAEEITPGFIENRRMALLSMCWATSPEMAANLPAEQLSLTQLGQFPIISFLRESPVYRNIAQGMQGCADLRINYFSSLGAMVDLACAGFGIMLVPAVVIDDKLRSGLLVRLRVDPEPVPLPLVVSHRLEQTSMLAEVLVNMAQEECNAFLVGREQVALTMQKN